MFENIKINVMCNILTSTDLLAILLYTISVTWIIKKTEKERNGHTFRVI